MSNSEQRGGLGDLFGDIFGKDAATNTTSGSNHDEESATSPGIVQDDWSIAPGDAKRRETVSSGRTSLIRSLDLQMGRLQRNPKEKMQKMEVTAARTSTQAL